MAVESLRQANADWDRKDRGGRVEVRQQLDEEINLRKLAADILKGRTKRKVNIWVVPLVFILPTEIGTWAGLGINPIDRVSKRVLDTQLADRQWGEVLVRISSTDGNPHKAESIAIEVADVGRFEFPRWGRTTIATINSDHNSWGLPRQPSLHELYACRKIFTEVQKTPLRR